MAASSPAKILGLAALLAPLTAAQAAPVVSHDRRAEIFLDSQSVTIDLKTNTAVFGKVRIAQGAMSITADEGKATQQRSADMYFENNVWYFKGNVKITLETGQLTSDDATITFVNSEMSKVARGNADTIDYDSSRHIVRFLKDAYLSNGENDIRGQSLKYDVQAQKVIAEEAEQNSQRVRITITPPPKSTATKPNP